MVREMKFIKKVLSGVVALLVLSSCLLVYADSSCASWNNVTINQTSVGHSKGCTVCTMQLILQNSQTLKSEYQLSGSQTSSGGSYAAWESAFRSTGISSKGSGSYDSWVPSAFVSGANSLTDATWSTPSAVMYHGTDYNGMNAIVGFSAFDFKDMSYEQQVAAMKGLWNMGYFVAFCVEYKGVGQESNGPSGYKAAHATMLAGVDDTDIYFNDPAIGKVCLYKDRSAKGGAYNLVYVLLYANDKTSPLSLSGGAALSATTSEVSAMTEVLGSESAASDFINGYWSEDELSSYVKLKEVNIDEIYLQNATREGLGQSDLESLTDWERNVEMDNEENGFISWMRTAVMFIGIVITVWMLLIYIAFWFDRINTFVYLDMLCIVTFGQLHIAPSGEKPTFSMGREVKYKTVGHKEVLFICLTGILFAILLISGVFYKILSWLMQLVFGWLR